MKRKLSTIGVIVLILFFLIVVIYLIYNSAWKIGGFLSCVNPNEYTILKYTIEDNELTILYEKGDFYSTPTLGYLIENRAGVLKIGLKYRNGYIAHFHKGHAVEQLTIPYNGEAIDKIVLCGAGIEMDINERYNREAYESLCEYIP